MNLHGPFFLVRTTDEKFYETGSGNGYAVPKLYTKGSATNLVNKRNKVAETFKREQRWEKIPVTLTFDAV